MHYDESHLSTLSTDELKDIFRQIRAKSPNPPDKDKLVESSLAAMRNIADKIQAIVDSGDVAGTKVDDLGPDDGFCEGAKRITLPDGAVMILGDRTEEAKHQLLVQQILKEQDN